MPLLLPRSEAQTDVRSFCPSKAFKKLPFNFDINQLKTALDEVIDIVPYQDAVINAICLTQIPGDNDSYNGGNLRGIFWTRPDDSYQELVRENPIDEAAYSEFISSLAHTYFKEVYDTLSQKMTLGRVRLLRTFPRTSLSWHRDPEPRIHIPIMTNPGAIMLINHHCTHMPADGSVYFTDTTYYHSALNGGEQERVHLVASVVAISDELQNSLS